MALITACSTGAVAGVGGWLLSSNNPSVARLRQKAVTLADGNVLLIGGQLESGGSQLATAACDIYYAASGLFAATGSMSVGRYEHAAVRLADGRVLVAGGVPSNTQALTQCEIYNPATGIWSAGPSLPVRVSGHEMVLLPNGKVLLAGGGNYIFSPVRANCYLFDPTANAGAGSWSATGNLSVPRMGFHLVMLDNGFVLASCGRISSSSPSGTVLTELYNPSTGTWSLTGNMLLARGAYTGPASTATKINLGRVLVTGGNSSSPGAGTTYSETEIYDSISGTWSTGPALPAPRELHEAVLLNNGNVLVAGGRSTGNSQILQSVLLVPTTMTWTSPQMMKASREVFSLSVLPNGNVLAPLGSPSLMFTPHSNAEIYNPTLITATTDWSLYE